MRLSRQEMVDAALDFLSLIEAGKVDEYAWLRVKRLREGGLGLRSAHLDVQLMADEISRLASQTIGGERAEWRDAAAAALGCRDNTDAAIEVLREVAERARQELEPPQPAVSDAELRAHAEPKKSMPIRSTLGNRNRKRGSR